MKSPMKKELSSIFPQHNEETIISTYDKVIESLGEDSHPYILPTCIERLLELPDTKKSNQATVSEEPSKSKRFGESLVLHSFSTSSSDDDDTGDTGKHSFVLSSLRMKRQSDDEKETSSTPASKRSKIQDARAFGNDKDIVPMDNNPSNAVDYLKICKSKVRDIISDIDDGYLEYLLNKQDQTLPVAEIVNIIVEYLLENNDYPRTDPCSAKTSSQSGNHSSISMKPCLKYEKQSIILLQNKFPKVPTSAIRKIFATEKTYSKAQEVIETVLNDINDGKTKVKNSVLKSFLRARRGNINLENIIEELVMEIESIENHEDKGECSKIAGPSDSHSIECGCCYNEIIFEEMVQCSEGHLFCVACLQNYSKEAVYGSSKLTLLCMTQGCGTTFPRSQLRRALSDDMMEKYMERVQNEDLKLANIKNLVKCPHCEFHAEMDDDLKVFHCQNSTCLKATCRYCQEEWKDHMGLRCNEVEKKEGTNLRTSYEEKMTEAKVRRCLQCSTIFLKFDGCNKMTCRCGAKMCYVCRKDKVDYDHFCQHPRNPGEGCTKCKKCCLWTDPSEDDERAIAEIKGQAEKESAKLSKGKESSTISIGPTSSASGSKTKDSGGKPEGYFEYYGSSEEDDDSDGDDERSDYSDSDDGDSNGSTVDSTDDSNSSEDSDDCRYW